MTFRSNSSASQRKLRTTHRFDDQAKALMSEAKLKASLLFRGALTVTLGTLVGYYWPDLNLPGAVVSICACLAIKQLTSFSWAGVVLTFILTAGTMNTGGHLPTYLIGRSILTGLVTAAIIGFESNQPSP